MKAILSDIHGNIEALEAVLEDMKQFSLEAVYCLGDMIGYGPDPRACLDRCMEWDLVLLGNHDQAALFDPSNFNPAAERAIAWTRSQLEAPTPSRSAAERRWDFLGERPVRHKEGDFLFVHGSPRNPLNEYVFPEDVYNQRKIDGIFGMVTRYCFMGHTHLPGVFTESRDFYTPEELDYSYRLDGRKTLVNVGSVGQPRDGDWRASYIVLDGDLVRFRRVEYDVAATVAKVHDDPDLDDFLGDRLLNGK
jgi:predicted phosphodiesterase